MTDVVVTSLNDASWRSMNFRAVFAGWLVATGVAVLLFLAGLALGFSVFDAGHSSGKGVGIGTAIWVVLVWAASLFVGGLFASWYDAHDDQTIGSLHGVTVWGLSVVASMLWLGLGIGGAMHAHGDMSGGGMNRGDAMHAPSDPHTAMIGDGSIAVLDANIAARLPPSRDHGATMPIVAALLANKDDTAANLLAADAGITHAAAAQMLSNLTPETEAARLDAKNSADRAAHDLAIGLWALVVGLLVGLMAAAVGGWLGAGHVHRVYHLRSYPRSVRRTV